MTTTTAAGEWDVVRAGDVVTIYNARRAQGFAGFPIVGEALCVEEVRWVRGLAWLTGHLRDHPSVAVGLPGMDTSAAGRSARETWT
jgi:hypothetical protein